MTNKIDELGIKKYEVHELYASTEVFLASDIEALLASGKLVVVKEKKIVMVGGSRGFKDRAKVENWVKMQPVGTTIIHGACPNSPDEWAGKMAKTAGLVVGEFPYIKCFGMVGGHVRNRRMVDIADHCVFFWDKKSQGTGKTILYAQEQGKSHEVIYE